MAVEKLPAEYEPQLGTGFEQDLGVVLDEAQDGTQYARALMPQTMRDLDVRFTGVEREAYVALVAFFDAHRLDVIELPIDGITYRARPTSGVRVTYDHGASMVDCAVRMRGVVHGG